MMQVLLLALHLIDEETEPQELKVTILVTAPESELLTTRSNLNFLYQPG